MTGNLFIDSVQIGQVDFTVIDESMRAIGGQLNCSSTYESFRGDIQRLSENKGIANREDFSFSVWIDDKIKLTQEGGIGVTDLIGFDEIYVEVGGLNEQELKQLKYNIMAIFGIGATYDRDVSNEFIINGVACVGWDATEAPALHEILRFLKLGDIIYIKSAPIGQGIRVKGIGIVRDNTLRQVPNLGTGVAVTWVWSGHENLGAIDDKYNVRNNTLYEEFNRDVQERVLELLFTRITALQ